MFLHSSYTWLALGDSYTIGEAVAYDDRYAIQTVALLKKENINVAAPHFIATTGWTTADLLKALMRNPPPEKNYNIVTLLIGVNNQYQKLSLDEYKAEFTLLLHRAIGFAGDRPAHVIVLSIPDWSVTPFANDLDKGAIAAEIDKFNHINNSVCDDLHVKRIDVTPLSRLADKDPLLIASDGLHFSGKEYAQWAALLAPAIKEALDKGN